MDSHRPRHRSGPNPVASAATRPQYAAFGNPGQQGSQGLGASAHATVPGNAFEDPQALSALNELRRARRPAFAAVGGFFSLSLANELLAGSAREFMALPVAGPLNIGFTLALVQWGSGVWAVVWYARYASGTLDPLRERLRALTAIGEGSR